jgi:hypothetical protein
MECTDVPMEVFGCPDPHKLVGKRVKPACQGDHKERQRLYNV